MSSWSQGLSGERFDKVFPFFLELDAAMCVRACGSSLERICEGISSGASHESCGFGNSRHS